MHDIVIKPIGSKVLAFFNTKFIWRILCNKSLVSFDLYLDLYATIIPVYIDYRTDVNHGGKNKMLIYLY